jgi:hypothetical protein
MDWTGLAQNRDRQWVLVNTGTERSGFIKCWEILQKLSN